MTDKVQKIREEVERLYNEEYGSASTALHKVLDYIDSLQEEPVSIWHDASEIPEKKKWILLVHKEGWYHVGRLYEGQRRNLVIFDGVSTFELNMFNKWVYVDDI